MNWFYDKEIFKTELTTSKNEIGQSIESYKLIDIPIECDIQPIDEKSIKTTWGEDIKSNIQIFCDEGLKVGDILTTKDIVYEIEKKVPWDDYYIYALLESEVVIK